mgnify:FL=1
MSQCRLDATNAHLWNINRAGRIIEDAFYVTKYRKLDLEAIEQAFVSSLNLIHTRPRNTLIVTGQTCCAEDSVTNRNFQVRDTVAALE